MENYQEMFLTINASLDRGIKTIKSQIDRFVSSFSKTKKLRGIVFLDEVDSMVEVCQVMLAQSILPVYRNDVLFLLACNDARRIRIELETRCLTLIFRPVENSEMLEIIDQLERSEPSADLHHNLHRTVIECSDGDARRMIDLYQTCCTVGVSDKKQIYELAARPESALIEEILSVAKTSTKRAVTLVKSTLLQKYAYSVDDIIVYIENFVRRDNFKLLTPEETQKILAAIYFAKHRLSTVIRHSSVDSWLQLSNMIASLHQKKLLS